MKRIKTWAGLVSVAATAFVATVPDAPRWVLGLSAAAASVAAWVPNKEPQPTVDGQPFIPDLVSSAEEDIEATP